jgi:hypothetical protein
MDRAFHLRQNVGRNTLHVMGRLWVFRSFAQYVVFRVAFYFGFASRNDITTFQNFSHCGLLEGNGRADFYRT